jgi:hypothetical protein
MLFGYLAGPSSRVILPQFQHLAPGDVIPLGAGPDWPVSIVEPDRALVVEPAGQDVTWCWMLDACGRTHTRLISRVRVHAGSRTAIRLLGPLIDLPWFLMERKMLLGIAERAEAAARETVRTGAAVDLYWIPLGAGGHSVRFNGRVFEALAAARRHRRRCDLYHAALIVEVDGARHVIEIAPSPDRHDADRGVVGTGAVGSRHLGRWRLFRYEVRCWRGGSIPDLGEAVGGARRLTEDARVARRLLDLVPAVPRPVWGRDELDAGEMWNSNSMIAWLLSTAGLPTDRLRPPPHGRAPGWDAGLELARRSSKVDACIRSMHTPYVCRSAADFSHSSPARRCMAINSARSSRRPPGRPGR